MNSYHLKQSIQPKSAKAKLRLSAAYNYAYAA